MARQKSLKGQLKSLNTEMSYNSVNYVITARIWTEGVYTSSRANDIYKWLLAAIKEKQERDFSKPLSGKKLKVRPCKK